MPSTWPLTGGEYMVFVVRAELEYAQGVDVFEFGEGEEVVAKGAVCWR